MTILSQFRTPSPRRASPRIYCNVRNYFPSNRGYLLAKDWDFGPVDRKVLGSVGVWKEPDEKAFDWPSAVKEK